MRLLGSGRDASVAVAALLFLLSTAAVARAARSPAPVGAPPVIASEPVMAGTAADPPVARTRPVAFDGSGATEAEIAPYLDLAAFLLGRPLTAAERDRLVAEVRADRARDPEATRRQLRSLATSVSGLAGLVDPVQRARARDMIFAQIWAAAQRSGEESELLAIVSEADPVVLADPASGAVATLADVDAFLAFDAFVAALAGTAPAFGPAMRTAIVELLRSDPVRTRPLAAPLSQMSVMWTMVQPAWARLTPAQQQAIAARLRQAAARTAAQEAARSTVLPLPGPLSMEGFGARMSRGLVFQNAFLSGLRMLGENMPTLPPP